ncbi:MAG: YHYH protein [Bacteroidia bacterium]
MTIIKISCFALLVSLALLQMSNTRNPAPEIPAVYKKIYGATSITSDGEYLTIKANGLPDHKSTYYAKADSLYQDFSGKTFENTTFRKNPNNIAKMNYTFKIPLHPKISTSHRPTPLGPIGIAVNGVPLFNQYAGPNRPLSFEINSFDQYWGHPARQGDYHYHVEPTYLTRVKFSKAALLGFLLDGFPVYGPEENNKVVTEEMLDEYHGHFAVTADYPKGIYHYHITNADPYINGSGFYGTAGTVSR